MKPKIVLFVVAFFATVLNGYADKVAFLDAAQKNDRVKLEKEPAAGVSINAQTSEGNTDLSLAAFYGKIEALKFLLDHGANTEIPQKDGYTPFIVAAQKGFVECLAILAKAGANKDAVGKNKGTSLFI